MQVIKVKNWFEIPAKFTGKAEYTDGGQRWLMNGKQHRLDGPAVIHADGSQYWFVDNVYYGTEKDFIVARDEWLKTHPSEKVDNSK